MLCSAHFPAITFGRWITKQLEGKREKFIASMCFVPIPFGSITWNHSASSAQRWNDTRKFYLHNMRKCIVRIDCGHFDGLSPYLRHKINDRNKKESRAKADRCSCDVRVYNMFLCYASVFKVHFIIPVDTLHSFPFHFIFYPVPSSLTET